MTGPRAGDRVSEYVLTERLGTGAFGQVWKATHHIWRDRVVAIKIPTDPQYVQNLRHEGVALHGLEHPNIVRALGLDPFADPPYFVMEYVDGCSLRDCLQRHPNGMPVGAIAAVMRGVLAGLSHAHQRGVVHRDIKPENILVAGGADRSVDTIVPGDVKVTDFGLGRAIGLTTQSIMQSGSLRPTEGPGISGTLAYMSPEQREGAETDPRCDLYSLGVVLFEMACGERPSGTETPGSLRSGLPVWVDALFTRLYARRDRRLSRADEAMQMLEEGSVPPVVEAASGRRTIPPLPPTCPACGHPTQRGDHFCTQCGHQISGDPRRCAHCRGYLEDDDRFCIFCGAPVDPVWA
ncbi:MAG: serine/threonine-protein kinase [Phycisphaerae bacterium]|nr:serine/threonine-protein kinase [Phycisphaerae bacterium]